MTCLNEDDANVSFTISTLGLFSANESAATPVVCDCDAADRKPMSPQARRESPRGQKS